jgi:hypothetical protein
MLVDVIRPVLRKLAPRYCMLQRLSRARFGANPVNDEHRRFFSLKGHPVLQHQ